MSQLPAELVLLIQQLYSPSAVPLAPERLAYVQNELARAQTAPEAWSWASTALAADQNDPYIRFFGAHTIASKLEREFFSLPEAERVALRRQLLSWLAASSYASFEGGQPGSGSEKVVLRKLSAALASAIIFSRALQEWAEWPADLLGALAADAQPSRQGLFLVLAELAQEERSIPNSIASKAGKKGPQAALDAACLKSLDVVSLLASVLQASHPACPNALRCVSALLSSDRLSAEDLSTLYPFLPPMLGQEQTMELAAGIVEDCLIKSSSLGGSVQKGRVDALANDFALSLSAAFEGLTREDTVDAVPLPLIRLFATLMESLIFDRVARRLLEPVPQQLFRNLLHLTSAAGRFGVDEEISNLAFPLWVLLQEEAADAGIRADGKLPAEWQALHAIYAMLWPAILSKIQLGSEHEWSSQPKDIRERFEDYRREASEVLVATYWVLRGEMTQRLFSIAADPSSSTEAIEAALFAASKVVAAAMRPKSSPEVAAQLEAFFAAYTFGRQSSALLIRAEMDFLGACATWLSESPSHVLAALNAIVNALQAAHTAKHAARALQSLCKHCGSHLAAHLGSFAGLIASSFGHLSSEDFASLVGAVGTILEGLRTEAASKATISIGAELSQQLLLDINNLSSKQADDRLYGLEAFCAFAKSISHSDVDLFDLDGADDAPDPFSDQGRSPEILQLRRQLYDGLLRLAQFASQTGQAERLQDVERLCMSLTSSTTPTALSLDSLDVLEAAASCASQSLWLLVAAGLVARISRDGTVKEERLRRIMAINQGVCQAVTSSSNADDPDTLQALMTLQTEVLRSVPVALEQAPDLVGALLQLAVRLLSSPERPSVKVAVEFMSTLALEQRAALAAPTIAHLPDMLHGALMRCLQQRDDCAMVAELLVALTSRLPEETRASLASVLSSPSYTQSNDDKTRLSAALMKARTVKTCTAALEAFL